MVDRSFLRRLVIRSGARYFWTACPCQLCRSHPPGSMACDIESALVSAERFAYLALR
jgi:hypothetical protein